MDARRLAACCAGYMAWAMPLWLFTLVDAGWFGAGVYGLAGSLALGMALLLLVAGLLAVSASAAADALVMIVGGAFFATLHWAVALPAAGTGGSMGFLTWFHGVWCAAFAVLWLAARRGPLLRTYFLLALSVALASITVGGAVGTYVLVRVGGYIGLFAALLAFAHAARCGWKLGGESIAA